MLSNLPAGVVCSQPRPHCVRYLVLAITVPDCRAPRLARLFPATAALATAWVGAASWFLLVWALKVRPPCPAHPAHIEIQTAAFAAARLPCAYQLTDP